MKINNMEISYETSVINFEQIKPDTIYNRFDLWHIPCVMITAEQEGENYSSLVNINGTKARLGLYLSDTPSSVVREFCDSLFAKYPQLKQIEFHYAKYPLGYAVKRNHWRIQLPSTKEELSQRLSKKSRYNTEREKKIIENTFGGYRVEEYDSSNCPIDVIEDFFRFKSKTHHTSYRVTSAEYFNEFHVSNAYVLRLGGGEIGAILFSCEQCSCVYVENLTYNEQYSKYSCGKALYDIFLARMIEKGKKEIFLGSGNLEYKKKYGSIEETVYHCIVFRNAFIQLFYVTKRKLMSLIQGMYCIIVGR